MSLDSIQGIKKVDVGGSFYTLWAKWGKWETERSLLFEQRAVVRQTGVDRAGIDVPASYSVLKLSQEDREEHGLHISGILIRDDYRQALDDISYFATHYNLPLQDATGSYSGEVDNPFYNTVPSNVTGAVTLLGHPGIGKSLWAILVLVLRILAGRPTIYHSQSQICYVFNADGLYVVNLGDAGLQSERWRFYHAISSDYWCLVDCNRTVQGVPESLSCLEAFIVQSASPRIQRLEWRKKYEAVSIEYYMRPWTLSELIMGRTLQTRGKPCSEVELEVFYSRYAPSARTAYTYAHQHLSRYDNNMVKREIGNLTYDKVASMLSAAEQLGTEREGVSHHILLISPQSNREMLEVSIPTRYIYKMLRDHLHIKTLQEASKLYQIFVRNAQTKASAGYIFEDVHNLFCKGGEWRVTPLTRNNAGTVNTHFKSPTANASPSYMCFGHDGDQVNIAPRRLPDNATFVPLACRRYLLGQMITLKNGYYQPAPGQATLDGFIYDEASKTATMLQMTVATKHDVKTKGVEWLKNQGAEKLRLVAVTPPDTPIDLPVLNTLVPHITEVYNLVVKDIL
ncbi:hypothetical protein JB92DRAFT_3109660 [Gautieria morchelliformis]|nr:hypothetical protein JB92DRAFT_3109660 [Gautieria morchelliformis]